MLEVQRFLRSGKTLEDLEKEFGVYAKVSDELGLAICNYDQIESEKKVGKRHPVVRECRALTLELGTWEIRGRSFYRFFNANECPDLERAFRWDLPVVASVKEDGSLMTLFRHRGQWVVTTRGSFANQPISEGCPTWRDAFWGLIKNREFLDVVPNGVTLNFEFCSLWNKVVREYRTPKLFLLAAFYNQSGVELNEFVVDNWAAGIGVDRPAERDVSSLADVLGLIADAKDPTFEGYVIRSGDDRLKTKNPDYLSLHALKSNGNGFAVKSLLPLVLAGEADEILANFPEASERVFEVAEKLGGAEARLSAVWSRARGIASQKDFALYVNKHAPRLSAVLFKCRKEGREPASVLRESEDLLLKVLF